MLGNGNKLVSVKVGNVTRKAAISITGFLLLRLVLSMRLALEWLICTHRLSRGTVSCASRLLAHKKDV